MRAVQKGTTIFLARFGLELNTEKTRLIEFCRRAEPDRKRRGEGKRYFTLRRKATRKRMVAKLKQIKQTASSAPGWSRIRLCLVLGTLSSNGLVGLMSRMVAARSRRGIFSNLVKNQQYNVFNGGGADIRL